MENRRVVVHGGQEQISTKTSIIHWFYKDPLCDESNEVETQKKGEKKRNFLKFPLPASLMGRRRNGRKFALTQGNRLIMHSLHCISAFNTLSY